MEKKKISNVIDLAAERTRRKKMEEKKPGKDLITYTPGPEFISFEEAYKIARRIVKRYSQRGALLKDFLARQKKSNGNPDEIQELHEALGAQRKMVAAFPTPDLKTLMGRHLLNSDHFDGVYMLAAAEEFIKRMGNTDNLPWK